MMTSEQIKELKDSIDALFASRTGTNIAKTTTNGWAGTNYGSLSGKSPAFSTVPKKGVPIRFEHGDKTTNLLRENFYATASQKCGEKRSATEKIDLPITAVKANGPIPSDFGYTEIKSVVDRLKSEKTASNGVSTATVGKDSSGVKVESSSCRAACTGLCVGSCIGFCNSCTSCSGNCVETCTSTCSYTCTTGCSTGCKGTCAKSVTGT